ncbi:MAG: metallophosphoesterase family protein, partial [Bacteroidota bacterium]
MKKILLMSDTHSYMDEAILKHVRSCDEVWHAGDIGDIKVTDQIKGLKPLRAVWGNIDNATVRTEFPEHQRFNFEGMDVWMTHIGGYPPKYNIRTREALKNSPPDLFICGH